MKIQRIKRKDLDVEKYSRALENAMNYRIYAEYWYLDVLTNEKWECLVYGDYEVIMPIPLQFKLGIKFVLQPTYCQQLGVFYRDEISNELFSEFEKKLHSYRVRAYHFNEENFERFTPKGEKRVNHLLDLSKSYPITFNDFKKDRKKDIRRCEKLNFQLDDNLNIRSFFLLRELEYAELVKRTNVSLTKRVIETLVKNEKMKSFSLKDCNGNLISICLLTFSKSRVILQFSARNKSQETKGSFAYLMALLIDRFSNQEFILDFEGSSIQGIATFNESFGSEKKYYIHYSNFR